MHLLFLTPQLPHPPLQGTAIRNWGLIKSLSARHRITLLAFAEPGAAPSPELRAACPRIETVPPPERPLPRRLRDLLFSSRPDLAYRLDSPAFRDRLEMLLQSDRFDATFVEGLELAACLLTPPYAPRPAILDAHNAETVLQRRAFEADRRRARRWPAAAYSLVQSGRLARYEAEACRRADHVTCVSEADAAALRDLLPGLAPVVVPNGIFLADYAPLPPDGGEGHRLVFTGKMDYRPNVDAVSWFADEIFPLVQQAREAAEFVIVGQRPTPAVQKLGQRRGITVTGAVPDARPYIARAAVYVAPLRMGGGTRFKLLEAMALRRAIVTTTLGAEGFAVQSGREVVIADRPSDFAGAVAALLADGPRRARLGEAGYAFVRRYDWEAIVPAVESLLAQPAG